MVPASVSSPNLQPRATVAASGFGAHAEYVTTFEELDRR